MLLTELNAGSRGEIALSICEAREAEAVPTLKEMRGISNFKDPALLLVFRAGTGTGTGTGTGGGGGGKGVRGIVVAEDRPSSL